MGILRKAKCTREGCTYKAMNKKEYEGRDDCVEQQRTGWCKRGNTCKYRHANDEPKMTEELMKQCVHNGGSNAINQAEEESSANGSN
jgi:hypothetical protein